MNKITLAPPIVNNNEINKRTNHFSIPLKSHAPPPLAFAQPCLSLLPLLPEKAAASPWPLLSAARLTSVATATRVS